MSRHLNRLYIPAVCFLVLGACTAEPAAPLPVDETPVEVSIPDATGPVDIDLQATLTAAAAETESLSPEDFVARHALPARPATISGYDPSEAEHFDLIDAQLTLTDAEKARIQEIGFAVSEGLAYDTFGQALVDTYYRDLPLYVTADMVLEALYRSQRGILKTLEAEWIGPAMNTALEQMHTSLTQLPAGAGTDAQAAVADADLFLTVARSLGAGSKVTSKTGVDSRVSALLELVEAEQMVEIEFFGSLRKMDFSQFTPRGHYTESVELERYFQMMIWLGRIDCRFLEPDPMDPNLWIFRPRQLAASLLLTQAVDAAGVTADLAEVESALSFLVGDPDYIQMAGVTQLADEHSLATAADVFALEGAALEQLAREVVSGRYGEQRILSHYLASDIHSATPTPLPPSFALMGQRFTVDSHVFAHVTFDDIIYNGAKVERVLPSPLDAMFALGNDHVVPLLAPELEEFPYQGNLEAVRMIIDAYEPEFWESTAYNLWLDALRTLNEPTTSDVYPEAMHTGAWADRLLNTQLGSWAQLRHNTVLYVKQSYTDGVACDYPSVYVEPNPPFFRTLARMAELASTRLVGGSTDTRSRIVTHYQTWKETMTRLADLADQELAGQPFSDTDKTWLKSALQESLGCGGPAEYYGWWAQLIFTDNFGDLVSEFKPTIVDVHTNPNEGPLPGPHALHVATGQAQLMVFTANTCEGPQAYVGPVFSYYEDIADGLKRYNDEEWKTRLNAGDAPPRPAFTESFLVE